jgi:hypothetical protein
MSTRDRPSAPFLILAALVILVSLAGLITLWAAG